MTDRIPLTLVIFRSDCAPYLVRDKRGKVRSWKTVSGAERYVEKALAKVRVDGFRVMTIDDATRCYGKNPVPACA